MKHQGSCSREWCFSVTVAVAAMLAACGGTQTRRSDPHRAAVELASHNVPALHRVTAVPARALSLCVSLAVGTFQSRSPGSSPHGEKIFDLYVSDEAQYHAAVHGATVPVGFTAVKQVWQTPPVRRDPGSEPPIPAGLIAPRDVFGFFVMTKRDPTEPGTDEGWLYGVVKPTGEAIEWGPIPSCVGCHREATGDRMLGLDKAAFVVSDALPTQGG